MFGIDLTSAFVGAVIIAVVMFKYPKVAVWVNKKIADGFSAYKKWRAARKAGN